MNRLVTYRQGAFTAPNAVYPVNLVAAGAANSYADGILVSMERTIMRAIVGFALTCDPPGTAITIAMAVYGYLRQVTMPDNTIWTNDGSTLLKRPWKHIITLASGIITPTYQAVGGVSVNAPDANTIDYRQQIEISTCFERVRAIPIVLTGDNPSGVIDWEIEED